MTKAYVVPSLEERCTRLCTTQSGRSYRCNIRATTTEDGFKMCWRHTKLGRKPHAGCWTLDELRERAEEWGKTHAAGPLASVRMFLESLE